MKKLTMKKIYEVIETEDKCGVNNLLQEIFAHPHADKGLDVIENGIDYQVISGTTFKVKTEKSNE